jgi:hypothetical protein
MKNQKGSATIVLLVVLVVVLAGGLVYFAFMKKPSEVKKPTEVTISPMPTKSVMPTVRLTATPSPTPASEKQTTYNLLKNITSWKVEDPVTNVQIQYCTDGTKHNPTYKVMGLSFGPGNPDTTPSIQSVVSRVKSVLSQNGWKKCTPNTGEGNYYSNVGPWFRETYIKNGKLLQLDWNLSMGVGYSMSVQFEY